MFCRASGAAKRAGPLRSLSTAPSPELAPPQNRCLGPFFLFLKRQEAPSDKGRHSHHLFLGASSARARLPRDQRASIFAKRVLDAGLRHTRKARRQADWVILSRLCSPTRMNSAADGVPPDNRGVRMSAMMRWRNFPLSRSRKPHPANPMAGALRCGSATAPSPSFYLGVENLSRPADPLTKKSPSIFTSRMTKKKTVEVFFLLFSGGGYLITAFRLAACGDDGPIFSIRVPMAASRGFPRRSMPLVLGRAFSRCEFREKTRKALAAVRL